MSSASEPIKSDAKDTETIVDGHDEPNTVTAPASASSDAKLPERPYSIFTKKEKWFIVCVASFAGVFSPLTANIYFPAIPIVATDFHKSTELINLTVTIYMVMQGVSPMFWGPVADRWGRRPIFVSCLLVLSLSCVGLALTPTNAYWLLMLLRAIQSAGSASTVALGAGVIGDIATRAERGGFFGLYSLGPMVGPSIGPVIGGALAEGLGWRSIFWFLCIGSALCGIFMLLFLPETLRCIVGDGSIVPSAIYRPVIRIVGRRAPSTASERPSPPSTNNPFRLLTYPDILLLLLSTGIVYAVVYAVTTTISTLFGDTYPYLTETDIGLCFLPMGGGMIFGSLINGKLLDRDYQAIKRATHSKLLEATENGGGEEEKGRTPKEMDKNDDDFPIERARLRTVPFYVAIFVAITVGYGWCLQQRVSIAVPLVLQFFFGAVVIPIMNSMSTLLVDLMPKQSSSVTACNNIVRCLLGAAAVSVINIITNALGEGWTYVLMGGIGSLALPVIWLEVHIGPRCRERRRRLGQ